MDELSYAGSPYVGQASLTNMNTDFMSAFDQMAGEYYEKTGKQIKIDDAWRSYEAQAEAYRKKPQLAAPPGHSLHEQGRAMDINSNQANELASMGLLEKYGFHRPMLGKGGGKDEPWHIQYGQAKKSDRGGFIAQLGNIIGPSSAEAAEPPMGGFMSELNAISPDLQKDLESIKTEPPETRSTGQRLAGVVADYLGLKLPVVGMTPAQIGALALGGTVGAGAGPAGAVAGAGLAYGAEEQAMKALRQYAGAESTQTLPESAIGAAKDVATGATYEAAGQIGGELMKPVAEKVGQFLTNRAKGLYERVLKAPPTVPAELRDRAVQTALEGDYAVTKKGLEKLQIDMSAYNQRVSQIIDEAAAEGKEIDVRKVVQKLESLKADYSKMPFPKKFITAIENAQNEIIAEHGSRIPVDKAQDMKQMIYKVYNKYYQSKAPIDPIDVEINQAVAQDIMKQLESAVPEVERLNKQWSNRINLAGLLERAVNRTRNYETLRLSDMIMATGGAAAERGVEGGMHAFIINRVLNNPTVLSKLALMLGKSRPWTKEALNRATSYGLVSQAREDIAEAQAPEKVEPESKRGFTILNQQP